MKIRTDFVTNSSSSSFVVEITIADTEGKVYKTALDPDDGGGNGSATLKCKAKDVVKVASVDELMNMLNKAVYIGDDWEEDKEETEYYKKQFSKFSEKVKNEITDLSQISNIIFKRTWQAHGEGASCFGWNLDSFAEELPELAKAVCDLNGDEKEVAKKKLIDYLAKFKGQITAEWGGEFPDGFMGEKGKSSIVWDKFAESIEEFAEKVVAEELPNDDYAESIVSIDMQSKKITQKAEYILGGDDADDYDEDEEENDIDAMRFALSRKIGALLCAGKKEEAEELKKRLYQLNS